MSHRDVRVALAWLMLAVGSQGAAMGPTASIMPATMPRIGTIDERYQSYNVEMLVTGGKAHRRDPIAEERKD